MSITILIVAEANGYDLHAPARCLDNIWLKATAPALAFQTNYIGDIKMGDAVEFCSLLRLKPGEQDLMGCAVGGAVASHHFFPEQTLVDHFTKLNFSTRNP